MDREASDRITKACNAIVLLDDALRKLEGTFDERGLQEAKKRSEEARHYAMFLRSKLAQLQGLIVQSEEDGPSS